MREEDFQNGDEELTPTEVGVTSCLEMAAW